MTLNRTIGLLAVSVGSAIVAAAPALGGSEKSAPSPVVTAYVKTIKQPYMRYRAAFHVALGPCYRAPNNQHCITANQASTKAAKGFLVVLSQTPPPASMKKVHTLFVRGATLYLPANKNQLRLLQTKDELTAAGFYAAIDATNDALEALRTAVPTARFPVF